MLVDIIVSSITLNYIFCNPLTEKLKIKNRLLIFIICFISLYTTMLFPEIPFFQQAYSYIALVLTGLIIAISTKNKLINIIGMILGYIASVVINNLILLGLDILFGLTTASIYSNSIILISFYILYFIVAYLLTKAMGKLIQNYNTYIEKPVLVYILIESILCCGFFAFNITYGRSIGYPSETIYFNCFVFLLFFLLTIAVIIIAIKTYKKTFLNKQEKLRLSDMQAYISNLESSNETYRIFKHDYMNILTTMGNLIHEKKSDELIDYFDNHIMKTQMFLDDKVSKAFSLSKIKSTPAKSIFISKINTATIKNIPLSINIENEVDFSDKNIIDIVTLLGIFLDNAIEATENADQPLLDISISSDNICTEVTIINSCDTSDIVLTEINKKGTSTKGTDRGLGLYNADLIIENNPLLVADTKIEPGFFIKSLIVYKEI